MQVQLTLTDERIKASRYGSSYPAETESYERAKVDLSGPARVVADALRAIANDIAPPENRPGVGGGGSGVWTGTLQ